MTDVAQRRTRSFGGCFTCRSRRIKCDEKRPKCSTCLKAGIACEGYEAKLKFVFYGSHPTSQEQAVGKSDRLHSRQQLFTEDQRSTTSRELVSQVNHEIDAIIERLDLGSHERRDGPFGVFSSQSYDDAAEFSLEDDLSAEASNEQISREAISLEPALFDFVYDSTTFNALWEADKYEGHSPLVPDASSNDFHSRTTLSLSKNPSISVDEDCRSMLPSSSHFLLTHYKLQMGTLFSPITVRKPIWSFLHLPSAMSTFSEMSVFGESSHAKSALFYGLLAVSAFNLQNIASHDATTHWWAVGRCLNDKAKVHLERACILELGGPKKSKYKDILMAVLNMITIAVVNAQQEEARSYLLNAELFMCVRSACKTHHSRKAKMLHQIYLLIRVIEESTYIYPDSWQPIETPSMKPLFPSMRFPSLRTHSLGQGRDIDELCGGNLEERLFGQPCCSHKAEEVPLFSQVYGIPESLFSLISRITALANEIAALSAARPVDRLQLPNHLHELSSALEKEVCGWTNDSEQFATSTSSPAGDAMPDARVYMPHFISAMHSATIILFYRRIHDLNPLLLQSQVEMVIDNLVRSETEKLNSAVVNTGIVWPGFIAAAEALSPLLQSRCANWLRECAKMGGMRNFELAADVARKVWDERARRCDTGFSWVDLVREQRLALVFT